jgi:hypothetical protein
MTPFAGSVPPLFCGFGMTYFSVWRSLRKSTLSGDFPDIAIKRETPSRGGTAFRIAADSDQRS